MSISQGQFDGLCRVLRETRAASRFDAVFEREEHTKLARRVAALETNYRPASAGALPPILEELVEGLRALSAEIARERRPA